MRLSNEVYEFYVHEKVNKLLFLLLILSFKMILIIYKEMIKVTNFYTSYLLKVKVQNTRLIVPKDSRSE